MAVDGVHSGALMKNKGDPYRLCGSSVFLFCDGMGLLYHPYGRTRVYFVHSLRNFKVNFAEEIHFEIPKAQIYYPCGSAGLRFIQRLCYMFATNLWKPEPTEAVLPSNSTSAVQPKGTSTVRMSFP